MAQVEADGPNPVSNSLKRKSSTSTSTSDHGPRKRKFKRDGLDSAANENSIAISAPRSLDDGVSQVPDPSKPGTASKKRKRKDKESRDTDTAARAETSKAELNAQEHESAETATVQNSEATGQLKARFIVFVGNLPYTATLSALESHFASLKPSSIRHLTSKEDPSKSKGYAFLEFAHYDRMRTCLKLFHHSIFDDGKTPARRINVELTAGGGGKSKDRKEKLKVKNQRLSEQRKRKKEKEDQERSGHELKDQKSKQKQTQQQPWKELSLGGKGDEDIHPSRRKMIGGRR